MRQKLLAHLGHEIEIVQYGNLADALPDDVTIECATCHVVLVSSEDEDED